MKKITCDVIKDILPLYVDDVLSNDSKKLIEDHINHCKECRDYYEKLKSNNLVPLLGKQGDRDKAIIKKIRRKINITQFRIAFSAVVLIIAIFSGIFYGVFIREQYVSFDDSGLYVENEILKTDTNYNCFYSFDSPTDKSIEFVYLSTTLYHKHHSAIAAIEVQHFNTGTPSMTVIDDTGAVTEYYTKKVYYISQEYAEKLHRREYWLEDGAERQNAEKLDELIKASVLIWEDK